MISAVLKGYTNCRLSTPDLSSSAGRLLLTPTSRAKLQLNASVYTTVFRSTLPGVEFPPSLSTPPPFHFSAGTPSIPSSPLASLDRCWQSPYCPCVSHCDHFKVVVREFYCSDGVRGILSRAARTPTASPCPAAVHCGHLQWAGRRGRVEISRSRFSNSF